jgi:hypothetical protein
MSSLRRVAILLVLCCGASAFAQTPAETSIQRDFWSADKIEWGDGRPYATPVKKEGPYPQGFKADFRLEIPKTGWYELVFTQGGPRHDLLVDDQYVWHRREVSRLGKDGKAGNLWLTAGKHTLRFQRLGLMGFPSCIFQTFQLRPSDGRPETCITAEKTLVDVVRAGEKLDIRVTGGGCPNQATYEILSRSLLDKLSAAEVVGEVSFSASASPHTKTVKIACPAEGAFSLGARIKGGKELLPCEFPIGPYAAVDVNSIKPASGKLQVVHAIDCVAQTDNGSAIEKGSFVEGNGPTRVTTSKAGTYRESHDGTPPLAPESSPPGSDQRCSSGFSYRIDLPETDVPYLLDLEFPDDARRSVAILGYGGYGDGGGKGYETGGMRPFTNSLKHHRVVFWPHAKQVRIALFSTQYLCRAAASRITVSRFEDGLVPASKVKLRGGRQFSFWFEEGDNWRHLVGVTSQAMPDMFTGLDRLARFCRYFGGNGMSLPAVGYQGAFFRTDFLDGFGVPDYDVTRLALLICEKYGMGFIPEIFPSQWYLNRVELPRRAARPEDIHSFDCHGAPEGNGANSCDLNPLHPVVQKLWIDALGDLADKLRDSPSFQGVTARADEWLFRGDFNLPGLYWGYGDWTMAQFERDRGIQVPGRADDPGRFIRRFEFLTSPGRKDAWIRWRCDRLLDYHRRLRDRIRGDRNDLFFGIAGDFLCDANYEHPDTLAERALHCGVDVARLKTEDGLAMMPVGRYGSRSFSVREQKSYDAFLDPEHVGAGRGLVRGFGFYFNYQEFGYANPWKALGFTAGKNGQGPYYCSACIAAGQSALEKYAVVLAEQDTSFARDGGDNDPFGDPAALNPWLAEFEALPALPFAAVESARDPVAVWHRELGRAYKDFAPGCYFYAVNREQYPVKIAIRLRGAGEIVRLSTGEAISAPTGVLSLELRPYELRAFKASPGAAIIAAATAVPAERIEDARNRLAFAQNLERRLAGPLENCLAASQAKAYRRQLDAAWKAMAERHCWRVRTALSMAPALAVYQGLSEIPAGQEHATFPGFLLESAVDDHWMPRKPVLTADRLVSPRNAGVVDSSTFNPAWHGSKTLLSAHGLLDIELEIPADGIYSLNIGAVAKGRGPTVAALGGACLPLPMTTGTPGAPETFFFPAVDLKVGKVKLSFRRDGEFGIYALQLWPRLRPTTNKDWLVIGPFKSFYGLEGGRRSGTDEAVEKGFATRYIPEDRVDLGAVYTHDGRQLRWKAQDDSSRAPLDDLVVGMAARTGSGAYDINYAVTLVTSDTDRTALLCLGVDWWAVAWLNGERLSTDLPRKSEFSPDFSTWRDLRTATLKLKRGVNTLLLKQQGGCFGSGFGAYLSDSPGIRCSTSPRPVHRP